jgi:hypothetical protein
MSPWVVKFKIDNFMDPILRKSPVKRVFYQTPKALETKIFIAKSPFMQNFSSLRPLGQVFDIFSKKKSKNFRKILIRASGIPCNIDGGGLSVMSFLIDFWLLNTILLEFWQKNQDGD